MQGLPVTQVKQAGFLQRVHVICRYGIAYGGLYGLVTIILNTSLKVFAPNVWYYPQEFETISMPPGILPPAAGPALIISTLGLVMLIVVAVRASIYATKRTGHFSDGVLAGLLTGSAGYLIGFTSTFIVYFISLWPIVPPEVNIFTVVQQRMGYTGGPVLLLELAVVAVSAIVGSFLGKDLA